MKTDKKIEKMPLRVVKRRKESQGSRSPSMASFLGALATGEARQLTGSISRAE